MVILCGIFVDSLWWLILSLQLLYLTSASWRLCTVGSSAASQSFSGSDIRSTAHYWLTSEVVPELPASSLHAMISMEQTELFFHQQWWCITTNKHSKCFADFPACEFPEPLTCFTDPVFNLQPLVLWQPEPRLCSPGFVTRFLCLHHQITSVSVVLFTTFVLTLHIY